MALADRVRRVWALSGDERSALVDATLLAFLIEARLRFGPLSRLVAQCHGVVPSRVRWPFEHAARLADLAGWPYRVLPLPSSCLRRSLVLAWVMRQRGLGASVQFGVRKVPSGIDAHAWVECGGSRLGARSDESFQPLGAAPPPVSRSVRWSP